MSSYISSTDNRIYTAPETAYGVVPAVNAQNRIPAVKLAVREQTETPARRDKTGGRTFVGLPSQLRKQVQYELTTYMTSWNDAGAEPAYGCLFGAALGAPALAYAGGVVASASGDGTLHFSGSHGLTSGQAIVVDSEMRFVTAVVDSATVQVNAPFSTTPQAGTAVGPTMTYMLGRELPSVSIYDFWAPAAAVQRVIAGAAVNELRVAVNGDFHEFRFAGPARRVVDNLTFAAGESDLDEFPEEPEDTGFDYSIVPGHLGQVWLGAIPSRYYTLTEAEVRIVNGIEARNREFGLDGIRSIVAGQRSVQFDFDIFAGSDEASAELFQCARQRSPISAMLQLGQQAGQLVGMFLKSVMPEVPAFNDSESRLQWSFKNCRAQGTDDDEIVVAIG